MGPKIGWLQYTGWMQNNTDQNLRIPSEMLEKKLNSLDSGAPFAPCLSLFACDRNGQEWLCIYKLKFEPTNFGPFWVEKQMSGVLNFEPYCSYVCHLIPWTPGLLGSFPLPFQCRGQGSHVWRTQAQGPKAVSHHIQGPIQRRLKILRDRL